VIFTCRRQTAGVPLIRNFAVAAAFDFRARVAAWVRMDQAGMVKGCATRSGRHCAVTNRSFKTPRKRCSKDHSAKNKFQAAAELCYVKARPLDNTDFVMNWRKQMARQYTIRALKETSLES